MRLVRTIDIRGDDSSRDVHINRICKGRRRSVPNWHLLVQLGLVGLE